MRTENRVGLNLDLVNREWRAIRILCGNEARQDVAADAVRVAGLCRDADLIEPASDSLTGLGTESRIAARADLAGKPPVEEPSSPRLSAWE